MVLPRCAEPRLACPVIWISTVAIALGVGFLGGMFGKGGSAVATPLLAAAGVGAMAAVASPLPATIPGTLVAYRRFRRDGFGDTHLIRLSALVGVPATVAGALATRWVGGGALVTITEVVVLVLGVRIVASASAGRDPGVPRGGDVAIVAVALLAGGLAGLLANAGGFVLVPLYLTVLGRPIKDALAASLAVSSVLALPGTIVHAALGHIDWKLAAVYAVASVPSSGAGARLAVRLETGRLERLYGVGLVVLGSALLLAG